MKKSMLFPLAILISLTLACSLSGTPTVVGTGPTQDSNPPDQVIPTNPPASTSTATPTPIPSEPVGFQEGLASLNSYSMVIDSNSTGPAAVDASQTHVEILASRDQNAKMVHYTSVNATEADPNPDPMESYSYTVGNITCSGSDENEWDYSEATAQAAEMQDLLGGLFDYKVQAENPTFVGAEAMNGLATNHFTFQISGLGLQSSAQVTANQGDYWLAQDGQYLVKYTLIAETQDPATSAVLHMDVSINLTNANQPVDIALPEACHP